MRLQKRDYSLTGTDSRRAEAQGMASAEWYKCPVPRKQMKDLMRRKDGPALRDTAIWLGLMVLTAILGIHFWGSWLAVPFFVVYGILYGSASDSRWHECGHGTAFKTQWMNRLIYEISSFMILRESTVWRWSHARHHTDTIIVGRDPEIAIKRPPDIMGIILNLFSIKTAFFAMKKIILHSTGRLTEDEENFIPASEQPRVFFIARIYLGILLATFLLCVAMRSWLPAMLVGLPTIYGGYLNLIYGVTQHAGLCDDVLDHRQNSRTIYMNPISRFIYSNMNYHLEHHMFPMVPYHALPALHEAIKQDCPPTYPSLLAAYREIIPILLKQRHDPDYHLIRELPCNTTKTTATSREAVEQPA